MPKGKTYRRKRPRQRRQAKGQVNMIRRNPSSGLPASMVMKHKYVDAFAVSVSTVPDTRFYRLNSVYDPYETGVGHQAYYFDQMATLYNKYTVYGCKAVMKATCETQPCIIGFKIQRDTAAILSAVDSCERPDVKYALLNPAGKGAYMSEYVNIAQKFGVTKQALLGDGDYASGVSGNPTKGWYLQVFAQHPNNSTAVSAFYTIELTYYVRWSERLRQNQS